MKNDNNSSISNENITYALAHCEAKLAEIARNLNQSESELREWVGILLLSSGTRTFNNLSALRGKTPKIYKTVRSVEMARNTHQHKPQKRGKKSPSGKKVKLHWMQRPENKARVKKMMKTKRQAYLVKLGKVA